jgi:hypothetical protein
MQTRPIVPPQTSLFRPGPDMAPVRVLLIDTFELDSAADAGSRIAATLALQPEEDSHEDPAG